MRNYSWRDFARSFHPKNYPAYLKAVFGSWILPAWLRWILDPLNRARRDKPRRFWGTLLIMVILAVGGSQFYKWWQNRPQPQFVTVTVTDPPVTPNPPDAETLKPRPVIFSFSTSAARLEALGKSVDGGIEMTPAIGGSWLWRDDKTLIFTPDRDWPAGQKYDVKFSETFFPEHILLATHAFAFNSPTFTAEVADFSFYQDPASPQRKEMIATLTFTHPVTEEGLKDHITLVSDGDSVAGIPARELGYTLTFDKHHREAYLHSENLKPADKDTFVTLTLAKGLTAESGPGVIAKDISRQASLPGMATFFRIETFTTETIRDEDDEPQQILIIRARDGVKPAEFRAALAVYALPPKDPPKSTTADDVENTEDNADTWWSVAEITKEVLARSTPVELTPLPALNDYETAHSFRFRAPENAQLYAKVAKGINSFGGYVLKDDADQIVWTPEDPREVKIMHEGSLLSLTGERKLSLMTRGIGKLRATFKRVRTEKIEDFISQSGYYFSKPDIYDADSFIEVFFDDIIVDNSDPGQARYTTFDFTGRLSAQKGLFLLNVEELPDTEEEAENDFYGEEDNRMVLVTDMGLMVKKNSDGTRDVFVADFAVGGPKANAEIAILGKNGLPVAERTADADGRAKFDSLEGLEHEREPVAIIARSGDDLTFMPLGNHANERELDFSSDDIEGRWLYGEDKLTAFVFSDRGVYRPGETIRAGIVVKSLSWKTDLRGVPVQVAIKDARGLTVKKMKVALKESGVFDVDYKTDPVSPTGTYNINVYLVTDDKEDADGDGETVKDDYIGSTAVKVEEFTPDQMKITARFERQTEGGWLKPDELKAEIAIKNLYGTPASDRTVKSKITLTPAYPAFAAYEDFEFYNPLRFKSETAVELPDAKTGADGTANIDLELNRFDAATYRLEYRAEGFAASGGRGVATVISTLVSPLDFLIAFRTDTELDFIKRDSSHKIDIIAVDANLAKIAVTGLKSELIEKIYVSTLIEQKDGTLKYQSVLKENLVSGENIAWLADGLSWNIPTKDAGDFELRLFNDADTLVAQIPFSVAGSANLARSLDKTARLEITLDKEEYAPGETITMNIKAPYTGMGLVTIERDRVYAAGWFKADTTATVQTIRIPDDVEGNAYVNIALIRARDSAEIYASPLSYAVTAFKVSLDRRTEPVKITAPEKIAPGDKISIAYSVDKPSKIFVWAVDEGILQFAGYKTPQPLAAFFEKLALEVRSFQTLDRILPEYSIYQNTASAGGDQSYKAVGNNLNPFKRKTDPPVAFWSGVIDADGEGKAEWVIPDYFNGSVRVMALAVNNERTGVAETSTLVRGPFTITPALPLFAAPGDTFDVNMIVANNVPGSGPNAAVAVTITPPDSCDVTGEKTKTVTIPENGETAVSFAVKTGMQPGDARFRFNAAMGDISARAGSSMSLRPAVPHETTLTAGHFTAATHNVRVNRPILDELGQRSAAASISPLILAGGLGAFVANYPYLCTEQLTSKGFAAMTLAEHPEIAAVSANPAPDIAGVLEALRARQHGNGAFAYWPGETESYISSSANFATIYALHFLSLAKADGKPVPEDIITRGRDYLETALGKPVGETLSPYMYTYATYVYTLGGEVSSNYLSNIRGYLDKSGEAWRTTLTGATIAATYKLLAHDELADNLIAEYAWRGVTADGDTPFYESDSNANAQYVLILARHFPDRLKSISGDELARLVAPLTENRYDTLSSAFTMAALSAYTRAVPADDAIGVAIGSEKADGSVTPFATARGLFAVGEFPGDTQNLVIKGPADRPTFYAVTLKGFDATLPSTPEKNGLEITRELLDESGKPLGATRVGDSVIVRLTLRTLDGKTRFDIVAVDLLPGGFEVSDDPALRKYSSLGAGPNEWQPDYADLREDRVLLFGPVGSTAVQFTYRIKAVSPGEYVIPPPMARDMYRLTISARGVAGRIRVGGR